jgi:hypothetical protein
MQNQELKSFGFVMVAQGTLIWQGNEGEIRYQ